MFRALALAALTLLAACSSTATHAPTSHPANPDAPAAASPAPHQHNHAAPTLYQCPMHPEVTSTNPNDLCPKCGMKINKPVEQPR